MTDPVRKARADRYRLKLMEQYLELKNISEAELIKREEELNVLLDAMGYFDAPIDEDQPDDLPAPLLKQKSPLLC